MFEMLQEKYELGTYLVPDNLAALAGIFAILLMLVLFYRVGRLYQLMQIELKQDEEKNLPQLLSALFAFAEKELSSLRGPDGAYSFAHDAEKNRDTGLFLIGAVEFVVKKEGLSSKQRHHLVVKLLKQMLGYSAKEISKLYSQAIAVCANSPEKNAAKTGARAYKKWSKELPINQNDSLAAVLA